MSGYRVIHRESSPTQDSSLWHVQTTPMLRKKGGDSWRIWSGSSDGKVRSHVVTEKPLKEEALSASALDLKCTHELGKPSPLGCTRVAVTRNYVGEDDRAGDLLVAATDLRGKVRVWSFREDMDMGDGTDVADPIQEFDAEGSSGTTLTFCPPRLWGVGDVVVASGCLDGTISITATGVGTPTCNNKLAEAGTVIESLGNRESVIAMSMTWHPKECNLAVGRNGGSVDIISVTRDQSSGSRHHRNRLKLRSAAVRAVTYTPDGHLLIAGTDDGDIHVWDVSRFKPTLVHHVVHPNPAHSSWIVDLIAVQDSRRFITAGADKTINVWNIEQLSRPVHTFQADHVVWSIASFENEESPRVVSGSENGSLQVYSLDNYSS